MNASIKELIEHLTKERVFLIGAQDNETAAKFDSFINAVEKLQSSNDMLIEHDYECVFKTQAKAYERILDKGITVNVYGSDRDYAIEKYVPTVSGNRDVEDLIPGKEPFSTGDTTPQDNSFNRDREAEQKLGQLKNAPRTLSEAEGEQG